jgi:hypothetical protein
VERLVWCYVFSLSPGAHVTAPDIDHAIGQVYAPITIWRALRTAKTAGLVRVASKTGRAKRAIVWERVALPVDTGGEISIEALHSAGLALWTAVNVIRALESGGWLQSTGTSYRKAP